jgi:DNA-binding CsgD family transcriptional regulator
MRRSQSVTSADVAEVIELVHECGELWADAPAWQTHLLRGVCRLTETAVGMYNEVRVSPDCTRSITLEESDYGWRDSLARATMRRMYSDHPDRAAFMPKVTRLAGAAHAGTTSAVMRHEIRDDGEWRRSTMLNEYRRPAFMNDFIISFSPNLRTGSVIVLVANQDTADAPPTQRGKSILTLLSKRIAPMVGTTLATGRQRGAHGLSPRLRQTLDGLLSGGSEKQIAAQMGISRTTLHEYVGSIYDRFGVDGRAGLMAYFLARRPTAMPGRCDDVPACNWT